MQQTGAGAGGGKGWVLKGTQTNSLEPSEGGGAELRVNSGAHKTASHQHTRF